MTVTIQYPGEEPDTWEHLDYEIEGPSLVRLKQHAVFIPLAPGDVVVIDEKNVVTGIHELSPTYTMEVSFYLPSDVPAFATPTEEHRSMQAIARTLKEWSQRASVTRDTNFSCFVSTGDLGWLQETVAKHRYVKRSEVFRTPDTKINYDVAIQHPDLDGTREGPFA